ncbi:hypothetical protein F2P81_002121 [Scophthalmus maximus]|uniref:Uncharacterized protein n=1 Tax=Scophthalmus maximus TaxID=52904 RepID=A0A6A4TUC3_SCOMX|nr:hypothetical protein F2P81_002121 [Scophthalmus maximus]
MPQTVILLGELTKACGSEKKDALIQPFLQNWSSTECRTNLQIKILRLRQLHANTEVYTGDVANEYRKGTHIRYMHTGMYSGSSLLGLELQGGSYGLDHKKRNATHSVLYFVIMSCQLGCQVIHCPSCSFTERNGT